MPTWYVQDNGKTHTFPEKKLRKKLRKGDLSGMELARPEGTESWRPLHALPIFSEEVAVTQSTARTAWTRMATGWAWHLASFVGVVGFLTVDNNSFPMWAIFWLIGLGFHTMRALPALRGLLGGTAQTAQEAVPESDLAAPPAAEAPNATQAATPEATPADTGFLATVASVIEAVPQSEAHGLDLAGLMDAARDLETRRAALAAACPPGQREDVRGALDTALTRLSDAPDEVTAEVYEQEVTAITERLAGMDAAAAVAERIAARQRTLLHQLEGLRLAALQADTQDATEAPALAEQTVRLRDELRAAAEVEEELARARRAARSRQPAR